MKPFVSFFNIAILLVLAACAKGGPSTTTTPNAPAPIIPLRNGLNLDPMSGDNVIPLSVNGSQCSSGSYPNKPCITVTVCDDSSHCTTINDILLDTGSYGLRVFKSVLDSGGLNLTSVTTNVSGASRPIAECVQYGDGSKQWGPVKRANVKLGNEPSVSVPIQVVDSTFTTGHTQCSGAMTETKKDFNGILGLGIYKQDCGLNCALGSSSGPYYWCGASSCSAIVGSSGLSIPLVDQVQNPVPSLPVDHNGVILKLPDIASAGAVSVEGYLVLGIKTQSNNQPESDLKTFAIDPGYGEFVTEFNGANQNSFIDSGSNSLAFPYSGTDLPSCSGASGWFCPTSTQVLSAVTKAYNGSETATIAFAIGNFMDFYYSPYYVSKMIGGKSSAGITGLFDWGLPFYIGRNVYHGIEGESSSLGNGPYWAY